MCLGNVSIADEVQHFDTRFVKLQETALNELTENKVSVSHFVEKLMILPGPKKYQNEDFVKKNFSLFEKAESIRKIFLYLTFYLSFIDFSLLEHIIEQFGSERLKEDMSRYAQDMTQFKARTTISDALKHLPKPKLSDQGSPPEGFSQLTVKFGGDVKNKTLEYLDKYRKKYADELLLSHFAFFLFEVRESSLLVTWLVPTALETTISENVQKMVSFFVINNVLELSLNGKYLYHSKLKKVIKSSQCYSYLIYLCASIILLQVSQPSSSAPQQSVQKISESLHHKTRFDVDVDVHMEEIDDPNEPVYLHPGAPQRTHSRPGKPHPPHNTSHTLPPCRTHQEAEAAR